MVSKSQEQFAQKIAEAMGGPIVIPVPTGGGGGGGTVVQPGNDTKMPMLPSADSSVMAMEYKYRITMGASI
jgi:acetyl/propionyl-CoA carboxylase alpha subunit